MTEGNRRDLSGDREPPAIVSACLAGLATTHTGKAKPHARVMELVRQGRAIPVCPEQLGGLPTPRTEAEIVSGEGGEGIRFMKGDGESVLAGEARVVDAHGADVTANFLRGAREALKVARLAGSTRAILKARSPSCGKGCIHDGTFSATLKAGSGVTAALFEREGLEVLSEEDLDAEDLRGSSAPGDCSTTVRKSGA
ncbi:MAG: DUF523 domain-containing protein [Actinomycetota bacterium]